MMKIFIQKINKLIHAKNSQFNTNFIQKKKKEILKYGIYIFVIAVWIAYKSHNTNQWAVFTKLI